MTSINVGDVIEDCNGMQGTVTHTSEMLGIRREFKPDGELLQVCLCDVYTEAGRHEIMFILERCHLIKAAGEVEPA
jgi:hypothetical protein